MEMKIKKEYILLLVIVVASALYLFFQRDSRINYEIPKFDKITKDEILKISIQDSNNSLEVKKEGDGWQLLPEGYKGDNPAIDSLVSQIVDITIMDLVSDSENYKRYNLDDGNSISIKVYNSEGLIREFTLGKSTSNSIYSYIRLKDKKGVYSVKGDLTGTMKTNPDDLRDKQVLDFTFEDINEVELNKGNDKLNLTSRKEEDKTSWLLDGKVIENSDEINSNLDWFSDLSCSEYLETVSNDSLIASFKFIGNGDHSISIHEKVERGYSATSSFSKYPFIISQYQVDNVLKLFED